MKTSVLRDRRPGVAGADPLGEPRGPQGGLPNYLLYVGQARRSYEYWTLREGAERALAWRDKGETADLWNRETRTKYDAVALRQASGRGCLECGAYGWLYASADDASVDAKSPCPACNGTGVR